jgi:hypothetical protein
MDEQPSIVRGGKGVAVSGCPVCKKKLRTLNQFMEHLQDDVLPVIADRVIAE